jgi:hypothetical protein
LKDYVKGSFRRGIVLYRGRDIVPFGDDMVALPLENLWTLDMSVKTDRDVRISSRTEGVIFWADYGERTRVRCLIARETIDDYFFDGGTDKEAIAAVQRHWETIWPILVGKIAEGRIEIVSHDNGPATIGERYQKIRQVTLDPSDIGFKDYRE